MAVAVGWTVIVLLKTGWEYPGYQLWEKAAGRGKSEKLELLKRAQRRLPSEPGLSQSLGTGLLEAGDPAQAAKVLEKGLEALDGTNFRLALAEAQLELGWLGPAELNARIVASRYPDRLRPRVMLARIHHTKGEDAEARAGLASCIRRDTYFRSAPVDSVVAEATLLWRTWYDDEPPR